MASFTFTSKSGSVSLNITRLYTYRFRYFSSTFSNFLPAGYIINVLNSINVCSRFILLGLNCLVTSKNMKYVICDWTITCFEIGSNVGPGCYCEKGCRLDNSTGCCILLSSCPPIGRSGNDHLLVDDL